MKPRRILTREETAEILEQATRENALCVLTTHDGDEWLTFKSRLLERDPSRRFVVLDYQETHGKVPPPLAPGQYVGISFRHRSRKVMFSTVVEARGRFNVDGQDAVPAIRYRWPETLTELQRRAYFRTPCPPGAAFQVNLWPGGVAARSIAQADTLSVYYGQAADLSCGGTLVRMTTPRAPEWKLDQNVGAELHIPDGRPPVMIDAYFRGARTESDGSTAVAIQFVGLELSVDGRAVLQRLAQCVQKFHRMGCSPASPEPRGHFSE